MKKIVFSESKIGSFTWELPAELSELLGGADCSAANEIARKSGITQTPGEPGGKEWTVEGSVADGMSILIAQTLLAIVTVMRSKNPIPGVLQLGQDVETVLRNARQVAKSG